MRNCGKCGRNVQEGPGSYVHRKRGLCHQVCPSRKHVTMKMGQRRPARRRQGCRGFKRDHVATEAARFADDRSYISLEKDGIAHELLFGIDKELRFETIAKQTKRICAKCKKFAPDGEWHHVKNGPGERCDCLHNAEWRHTECHSVIEHPQPQLRSIPLVMAERGGNVRPA